MEKSKVVQLVAPKLTHMGRGAHPQTVKAFIIQEATKEVECQVITCITEQVGVGFHVRSVVRYEAGGKWYPKEKRLGFSLAEGLKIAYGDNRKHFATTASRAFAGLLHDSVVPATEDIDF